MTEEGAGMTGGKGAGGMREGGLGMVGILGGWVKLDYILGDGLGVGGVWSGSAEEARIAGAADVVRRSMEEMLVQVLNGTVRRRSWLLALGALAALLALATLALMPARAAHDTLPSDFKVSLSLDQDSDNIVPAGAAITVKLTAGWTEGGNPPDALVDNIDVRDVVLRVSGTHEWSNGTHSVTLTEVDDDGVAVTGTVQGDVARIRGTRATTTSPAVAGDITLPTGITVEATISGEAHGFASTSGCGPSYVNGTRTWRCALSTGGGTSGDSTPLPTTADTLSIFIPAGTPDGPFTISLSGRAYVRDAADDTAAVEANVDGHWKALSDTLEVTVGTVDEATSVLLNMAPDIKAGTAYSATDDTPQSQSPLYNNTDDDTTYPTSITSGGNTILVLSILNEGGKAAAAGNARAVTLATNRGTLRAAAGATQLCGAGGTVCSFDAAGIGALNASNSAAIAVTLTYPTTAKSGAVQVDATVFTKGGQTLTASRKLTFVGTAETLSVSDPATALLHVATTVGSDNRDELTLTVSAVDASDNPAAVGTSSRRVSVKGPDDKTVPATSLAAYITGGSAADTDEPTAAPGALANPRVKLVSLGSATSPLKTGEYTLSVTAGTKSTTQKFMVAGDAATVTLSEPEGELAIYSTLTLTVTANDADGNPVPDGTVVTWPELQNVGSQGSVVRSNVGGTTKDGQATGTFLVVGEGTTVITASVNGKSGVRVIRVAAEAPAEEAAPADPADGLSVRAPGFASWIGSDDSSAEDLLNALTGFGQVSLWQNGQWLRYGVADGQEIPGSYNFDIRTGDILWLSR